MMRIDNPNIRHLTGLVVLMSLALTTTTRVVAEEPTFSQRIDQLIKAAHLGPEIPLASDGNLIHECAGHPQITYCVQFVPGSHDLVSGDIAPFGGVINLAFSPDMKRLTACGLYKTSNAPAGNRRAVTLSFDWVSGEKLPKQESLAKELDATMWRVQYHASGIMLGVVEKEIGFWKEGQEELFHMAASPSDIFDFDLHPNQIDLFTAHYDGHIRSWRCAAG